MNSLEIGLSNHPAEKILKPALKLFVGLGFPCLKPRPSCYLDELPDQLTSAPKGH